MEVNIEEKIKEMKDDIVDVTAKRVSDDVLKQLEEKFQTKFPTMDEIKKLFETYKPQTATLSTDEKREEEVKFWRNIAVGKATGDITDTGTAATLVPSTVANKILDQIQSAQYLRKITTVFPDDKGTLFVKSQGATAYRTAENAAPNSGTPSTLKYNAVAYNTYEAAADVILSNKLLKEASPNLLQFAYQQLGQAFANLEVVEFVTGSGTNAFQGLNNASITAVTAAATHTTIAKLDYDDLLSLYMAVPQQYRKLSSWIVTSDFITAIKKLKDNNGLPIFNATEDTIFGRPYYENSNLATTGTTNPVAYFGYWKDYYIFDKGKIAIVTTNQGKELVSKRQTYIIAFVNTDGKTVDKTGMRSLKLAAS